jgi:ketosteroid isomerase-like protein
MASANEELVRSIVASWEVGDFSRAADWAHPEIEFVIADGPAPGSWKGLEGMAEGFGDFLRFWDDYRVVGDEYREIDQERVLALVHRSGRGRTSGAAVEEATATGAGLWQLGDGKVTRFVAYFDRDRALADLGLTPEAE